MLPTKQNIQALESQQERERNYMAVSNPLLESFFTKPNAIGLKILFYIAKSNLNVDLSTQLVTFGVDISNLCKECNTDSRTINRNLKKMVETSISYIEKGQYESHISLIVEAKINFGGYVEITMLPKILKMLLKVKENFTFMDFNNLMRLKIKHSLRMLMLLERINGFGKNIPKRQYYSIDDLNGIFGTNYKTLYNIEQKILKKIKEELDIHSKLTFIYRKKLDKEVATLPGRPSSVGIWLDLIKNDKRQGVLEF